MPWLNDLSCHVMSCHVMSDEGFDCAQPPHPMTDYRCKTLNVSAWGDLLDFAAYANVSLLFGLNDLFMRPTKTKPYAAAKHQMCLLSCGPLI
jgi:hypothetical protein